MQWARYGPEKKNISALYYRETKHGDVFCRFCDGKMAYVNKGNRAPHFRVVDRKTHSCKYFGNDIEEMVAACSSVVQLDRKNNESPVFLLNMDNNKNEGFYEFNDNFALSTSISSIRFHQVAKEKQLHKFIFDIHETYLKNEYDQVLQLRFVINESSQTLKIKAEDLIPSYKNITKLDAKGKLGDRKRFIVGSILSAKETVKRNIEVTLRGTKSETGNYMNHKVIFMKNVLDELGLGLVDFHKNRPVIVYAKLKMNESKREVISFVSSNNDFDFGRFTSLDGDWLETIELKEIDDFFYTRNIAHTIPNRSLAEVYFQENNQNHVPGWVIILKDTLIVVDYADHPNDILNGPLEKKRDYFINRNDCIYMNIFKEDLDENYSGLKKKIHAIQPNLHLDFYES